MEVKIFHSPQFGQIRTAGTSEQPLFCLPDVCYVLELRASDVVRRLSDDVVSNHPISDSLGRLQNTNFVNEDGLYDVILDSRKPEAKQFRKWITSEVLPSIRKSGGYLIAKEEETPDQLMARALQVANETLQRKEQQMELLQQQNEQQTKIITDNAPKVEYYDKVLTSISTYTVTQIAKEFGFGAETLNKKLHLKGVQYKHQGQWLLYAKYQNKGYTATVTRQYLGSNGETRTSQHTVWTEKGRQFIHNILSQTA